MGSPHNQPFHTPRGTESALGSDPNFDGFLVQQPTPVLKMYILGLLKKTFVKFRVFG